MNAVDLSYVSGTSLIPLKFQTVGAALDEAAKNHPDNDALIVCHQTIRWSYRQLKQEVDRFAAGLLALGLKKGERIGIWSPNNAEWVTTQLAAAKAGLILVNINPAYRLSELEYALNKVQCRLLIHAVTFKSSNYVDMLRTLAPEIENSRPGHLKTAKLPYLEMVATIGPDRFDGFYTFTDIKQAETTQAQQELEALTIKLQPDDAMNIQFTSGTTGSPKGATLTHHNVLNNGFFVTDRQQFSTKDRLCIPVPLYHCFGMVMGVLGCITHAACMVFPDEAFEPRGVLAAIEKERCTALYAVPTMFIAMLDHPDFDTFDLTSLKTGVMAGTLCPIEVMRRVIDRMNMGQVTICYGMTETSPVSLQTMIDDPLEKRVTTVGKIHPHVEVKIVNEEGHVVTRGNQGELCTRGYSVMRGYWGEDERTHETIDAARWLHTGDLATMDNEGYVCITGRVKDMIIRGGENIYPREVEEFLYRHPTVTDVQVFGIFNEKYGEEVCAWIRLHPGQQISETAIIEYCKGQIAHFKVPRHIRFVDEFPMTVTGKAQKFIMKEIMEKELGEILP